MIDNKGPAGFPVGFPLFNRSLSSDVSPRGALPVSASGTMSAQKDLAEEGQAGTEGMSSNRAGFVSVLLALLHDESLRSIIDWSTDGSYVLVFSVREFVDHIMPSFFKTSNVKSFVRQLNLYGFHKLSSKQLSQLVATEEGCGNPRLRRSPQHRPTAGPKVDAASIQASVDDLMGFFHVDFKRSDPDSWQKISRGRRPSLSGDPLPNLSLSPSNSVAMSSSSTFSTSGPLSSSPPAAGSPGRAPNGRITKRRGSLTRSNSTPIGIAVHAAAAAASGNGSLPTPATLTLRHAGSVVARTHSHTYGGEGAEERRGAHPGALVSVPPAVVNGDGQYHPHTQMRHSQSASAVKLRHDNTLSLVNTPPPLSSMLPWDTPYECVYEGHTTASENTQQEANDERENDVMHTSRRDVASVHVHMQPHHPLYSAVHVGGEHGHPSGDHDHFYVSPGQYIAHANNYGHNNMSINNINNNGHNNASFNGINNNGHSKFVAAQFHSDFCEPLQQLSLEDLNAAFDEASLLEYDIDLPQYRAAVGATAAELFQSVHMDNVYPYLHAADAEQTA
eukprot:Opistho-2@36231